MRGLVTATNDTLLRFDDDLSAYAPARRRIVWVENTLDCRTWTYYCDLKDAMSKLHDLCIPRGSTTCVDGRRGFQPELVVAGPRYMANVAHPDETLGFDRERFAHLPLAVIQNKMYAASTREIVGDADAKLQWARAAGAIAGFTWLPTQHIDFTSRSGIPHFRLPFGVDVDLYGRHREAFTTAAPGTQRFDIGFTGASSHKYPLRESILRLIRSMPEVKSYLGTWQQTALRTTHNNSWKALDRDGYVLQISNTKMWVSTTGPNHIVGTRYFEILASGTTLLLCNRAPQGVYDGLFVENVHAVVFDSMDDLKTKIRYYLSNEPARRKIVDAAYAHSRKIHSWLARARFITRAVEAAIQLHDPPGASFYTKPAGIAPPAEPYLSCAAGRGMSGFVEVHARRPLRRFTVATCARACQGKSTHFAVQCGGFCSGNGHRLARCFCAKVPFVGITHRKPKAECATTCTLHDSRPCGGWDAAAIYTLTPRPQLAAPADATAATGVADPAAPGGGRSALLPPRRMRIKQGGRGAGGRMGRGSPRPGRRANGVTRAELQLGVNASLEAVWSGEGR